MVQAIVKIWYHGEYVMINPMMIKTVVMAMIKIVTNFAELLKN